MSNLLITLAVFTSINVINAALIVYYVKRKFTSAEINNFLSRIAN